MAISSIFRLDAFTRGPLREVCKELFVLLTALRSAGRRLKLARIEGLVEETVPLYSPSDFKRCVRICRGTFEQFSTFSSLATWDDQSRMISRQNYPKRTHILPIPSKPYSVHSAIGSRMNGIAFRSFRKRNRSQKNAIAVYSKYSYSVIVPKECAHSHCKKQFYFKEYSIRHEYIIYR